MELIIVFLSIIIISIAISQKLKTRIEIAIPISFMGIVLFVYMLGVFGKLKYCVLFLNIATIMSLIYIIYIIITHIKEKKIHQFIDRIITPGFLVFCLLYTIAILFTKDRIFGFIDEFTHWGISIKSMFNTGTFLGKHVRFTEYPPFTGVFQYIVLRYKGQFSESTVIFASNVIYICMIISILKNIDWKNNVSKLILYIPLMIFLPMFFYYKFFIEIIVDGLLGIFLAYIIYSWFTLENDKLVRNISVFLGLLSITLIKSTGIYFAIFAVAIFIVDLIITRKQNNNIKKDVVFQIVSILVALVLLFSWNMMIKINNTHKKWDINASFVDKSIDIIKGDGTEQNIDVIKRFVKAFFQEKNMITERNLTIFSTLLLIICIYIYNLNQIEDKYLRKRYKSLNICMFIECFIYVILLLVMYLFLFTSEESSYFASIDRYMNTMLLAMVAVNVFAFLEMQNNKKLSLSKIVVVISMILVFMPLKCIEYIYVNDESYKLQDIETRRTYSDILKYADILSDEDDIYFIANNRDGQVFRISKYMMIPKYIGNDENSVDRNIEDIKDLLLNEYEYLYIYIVDDEYVYRNKKYFKENIIYNKALYKINKENEEIVLERVDMMKYSLD